MGRAATPKAGACGGEAGKAQWGWRGDGDHVMALPVRRAGLWGEFPTFQVLKPGASSGRARAVGRTEQNAPSFPPPRAEKEGGRKEGSLSQTDTRVQSIWILLCFNLCGRRHMQRWFCSCSGGSRRAARVHQHSASGPFLSALPIPLLGMCSSRAPRLPGKEGCESKSCPSYSQ